MKTLQWQNFFEEQRESSGRVVFSVEELAEAAKTTLHVVNTELGRLVRRGVITRYTHGRYGPNRGVTPEDLVRAIDDGAYLTGGYALFRRGMVKEAPGEVICFTDRRHNRKGDRVTPAGRLSFRCVASSIYAKAANRVVASAEHALCDFAWLNLRDGTDPWSLISVRALDSLNPERLVRVLERYPWRVRAVVERLLMRPVETTPEPANLRRKPGRPRVGRVVPQVVPQVVLREEVEPSIPPVRPAEPAEVQTEEAGESRQENSWAVWD